MNAVFLRFSFFSLFALFLFISCNSDSEKNEHSGVDLWKPNYDKELEIESKEVESTESAFIKIKCKTVELAPSGKYRYTFNIKNFDPIKSRFNGIVTISIISMEGKPIRYEDFNLIDFENGKSEDVCIEAMTGLFEVHGEAGISKYGFSVKRNIPDYKNEGFGNIEEYKLDDKYELKKEFK